MKELRKIYSWLLKCLQRSTHLFIPARATFGFFPLPRYGLGMEKEHVRFQITTFVASIVALVALIHSPAQVTFGFFPPSPIWPWNGDASLIPARAMHSSQSQSRLKSSVLQSNWISTKKLEKESEGERPLKRGFIHMIEKKYEMNNDNRMSPFRPKSSPLKKTSFELQNYS